MSEERQAVDRARRQLRDDHERLRALFSRLRTETDRAVLTALLGDLPGRLAEHFRREEEPGGLYHALGAEVFRARGEVGRLVDDHFRLASMARDLSEEARSSLVATTTLRERAASLADYLADHEQREHQLGRRLAEEG